MGVWDVALTPTGAAAPLPAVLGSFHGNGRFVMGGDLNAPTLTLWYWPGAGGLSCRRDEQAPEEVLPVAWGEQENTFTTSVPQGTLAFRRRPVAAAFTDVTAVVSSGPAALEVAARLRVDHAPGLPVEVWCRVYDDDGRPVRARPGSAHADADGLLRVTVPLTPPHNWTDYKGFRAAVPLAELPAGALGREVRVTLAAWCPRDKAEVTTGAAWGACLVPAGPRTAP